MQITEITIHPTNEDLVKAYVSIVFDNCFMVEEIRVMQGPTGLFLSFPTKKLRDGTQRDIAFPALATGVYGFPRQEAAEIAVATVTSHLASHEFPERVIFVCFDLATLEIYQKALGREV